MKVISFIEPPQEDVIQKILKHCGLWDEPARVPPAASDSTADRDAVAQALAETELARVPIDEFLDSLPAIQDETQELSPRWNA